MRIVPRLCRYCCVALALLAGAHAGLGQEKGKHNAVDPRQALPEGGNDGPNVGPVAPPEKPAIRFQDHGPGIRISASMQTFAVANPISVVAVYVMAAADGETGALLFPDWQMELQAPLPLSRKWLDAIRDRTRNPNLAVPMPWHERPAADQAFIHLQWEAIIDSKIVPAELFKKTAEEKENRWVTYDDLWNHPVEYRGRIIPVKGKMIRLRAHKIRKVEATNQGIDFIYEAWVVGQTPMRNPYCIVFVNLPDGLEPQETMDLPVTFYGYFIKRFRYDAQTATRETALLIGPTVYTGKAAPLPARREEIFSRDFLYFAAGGLIAIAVVMWGLHLWFRQSDRAVHRKLAVYRERHMELVDEPLPAESPPPSQEQGNPVARSDQNDAITTPKPHNP